NCADVPLEVAYARLAGVMANEMAHRLAWKFDLIGRNPVLLDLPRNQVLERDVDLLLFRITLQFDDLHAITQRLSDRIEHVRRGDEQYFGKIEGHIEVIVTKGRVLLRIKRLEQCRSRIAAKVAPDFVNLIEHEHGIFRLSTTNA